MGTEHQLRGVENYWDSLLSEKLEANLYSWLSWGLLGIGAFENVSIPTSGVYGGDQHRLRLSSDPNYDLGQVWEGFRSDWVWETGIEYSTQPIRVSGVYVNGSFQPSTGVGTYAHHVNYPEGKVVFDEAIATGVSVSCEYSYRYVSVQTSQVPWWRQLQFDSFRLDKPQFSQIGSGVWDTAPGQRVQLPAVVIDVVPKTRREGFQIGQGRARVWQDVLFHVLSETPWDRQKLHDILTLQWDKTLRGFNPDNIVYPLEDGSPISSGTTYPLWTRNPPEGAYWNNITLTEARGDDYTTLPPMYYASVRMTAMIEPL